MAVPAKAILDQALKLPANDRAALVENLILSLDKPDPSLDAQWLKEAEDRLAARRTVRLADAGHQQAQKVGYLSLIHISEPTRPY